MTCFTNQVTFGNREKGKSFYAKIVDHLYEFISTSHSDIKYVH